MSAFMCPRWRNFSAVAEALDFSGQMNQPIEINLKNYLLQGANPIDNDVLNEKKFQGAFFLNYRAVSSPKFGKLEPGSYGTGWRYYPKKDYVGTDSFDYVLNNGSQDSNYAVINIEVKAGLSGSITVYHSLGKPYWRLTGTHNVPAGFGPYEFITYSWIRKTPFVVFSFGDPFIYHRYEVRYASDIRYDIEGKPFAKSLPITDWERSVWPDPSLVGYLPNSAVPYVQPPGPFPYTLRIDFFKDPIYVDVFDTTVDPPKKIGKRFSYWNVHDQVEIEITQDKGEDWWSNGQVIYVGPSDPTYPKDLPA